MKGGGNVRKAGGEGKGEKHGQAEREEWRSKGGFENKRSFIGVREGKI